MLSKIAWASLLGSAVLLILPSANAAGFKIKGLLRADPGSQSVALADFNHDGKLDLAEVGYLAPDVTVWIGTGTGTFQPPVLYSVGNQPSGVSVADVNLDGTTDLLVANHADDTISVLLGNGDGTFQPQLVFPAGDGPNATAVGDFNHDGIPDLVAASSGVAVLFGNGDGTFQTPTFPSTRWPYSVAVADFNRDGNLDIAMGFGAVQAGRVQLLLGHGDGTFEAGAHYSLSGGTEPLSIAVGDLNHDGKLDVVASTFPGSMVAVLLGHGDGTFRQAVLYRTPLNYATTSVAIADFNRDGNPDVAAAIFMNPSFVSVFNGNGDGTLQPPVSYNARGNEGQGIAAGDLNGDGSPDLVMSNTANEDVSILLNTGGTFLKTSSSLNPSHLGNSVTFTTQVKQSLGTLAPTGTVTFKDGNTVLGTVPLTSGVATLTTSTLSVGTHKIVASYSGDANFNPNDAKVLTQVVEP